MSAPALTVVFDWDDTLSTLHHGWEQVMVSLFAEVIVEEVGEAQAAAAARAREFVASSTGLPTIRQMDWLAEQVARGGSQPRPAWSYKAEYLKRLEAMRQPRVDSLRSGASAPDAWLVPGARRFLTELLRLPARLLLASGSDHAAVLSEAELLQVHGCFDRIQGASARGGQNPKETILSSCEGGALGVIGDGVVELTLGKARGAWAIGMASHASKIEALKQAGADLVIADYSEPEALLSWISGRGAARAPAPR